ncbi:MAG: DUF1343 domain-containing protein [Leptospiraceae bacterium]|nr:DUF1343 domain-containing protein [Leptospiraceae bacterium]
MQPFTERLKQAARQLEARRVGILANQTAYDLQTGQYSFQALASSANYLRVFLPEHGLFAELQDQVGLEDTRTYAACLSSEDRQKTDFLSLYGNSEGTLKPAASLLSDLDLLVVDLQDVGSRYYTFLTTLYYCLEVVRDIRSATSDPRLQCLVVDRSNPIGRLIEGTPLDADYASFVGLPGIIHRHGLSAGEMARFFARGLALDAEALVILDEKDSNPEDPASGKGWAAESAAGKTPRQRYGHGTAGARAATADATRRENGMASFPVYPSPNMPTVQTAEVYPGQCLLEGTNLSEGRGTTRPFLIFGAPFLGSLPFNSSLFLPGLRLRPLRFLPTFHKHAGQICEGFELHVLTEDYDRRDPYDRQSTEANGLYAPLFCTLRLLRWIRANCPDFAWKTGVYEFRSDRPAIELLAGDPLLLEYLRNSPAPLEDRLDDFDLALLQHMASRESQWLQETGFLWESSPLRSSSARLLERFA